VFVFAAAFANAAASTETEGAAEPVVVDAEAPAVDYPFVPHTAEYKVRISIASGKLKTSFSESDGEYHADSVIIGTGLARLISKGEIREASWFSQDQGLLYSRKYESSNTFAKNHKAIDMTFVWDEHNVFGVENGREFSFDLNGETFDRVSMQYGLMRDLANGQLKSEYVLQDGDTTKYIAVSNLGEKEIKVPFGKFTAVGVQHQSENSNKQTILWCAEELGYLPVLIEQYEDGKVNVRARLRKYETLE
jgi:hypothetical protein